MSPALVKHPKTLLVIVAEAALEKPLVRDARERGAQGWTVAEVHGASLPSGPRRRSNPGVAVSR